MDEGQASVHISPIGHVRAASRIKFDAPRQPEADSGEVNYVELGEGRQFELALQDLIGFDRIWLISWFDRNSRWRPRVLPPRGPAVRRGVFATRSPHRPNPIGLTCVPLLAVDGRVLTVGPIDLVDGTPILDIKPYLRTVDCFPGSSLGWVGDVEESEAAAPGYRVEILPPADLQLRWLREEWGIDFTERAFAILARDPSPHRTRRILQMSDSRYRMACGGWRLFFSVCGEVVSIEEVRGGYSLESLSAPGFEKIVDREALVAFGAEFP